MLMCINIKHLIKNTHNVENIEKWVAKWTLNFKNLIEYLNWYIIEFVIMINFIK